MPEGIPTRLKSPFHYGRWIKKFRNVQVVIILNLISVIFDTAGFYQYDDHNGQVSELLNKIMPTRGSGQTDGQTVIIGISIAFRAQKLKYIRVSQLSE